ncbi:gp59 [Mycobacterium phage Barnyard]|uniref:Uncharacterized protein n=1 Tax=Mycobacterium phage Barnyard TaxID=205880 RepID=Q856B3_9CAUD|nr:gp59 [Mycobacterium phage Barnyard]AAN02113.1 hypothetical protein PBI_BARNYARD_59 [Mycobacterium phage Barnyard]
MGITVPIPEEAKKALGRVDEMHSNLSAIRQLLETLVQQNAVLVEAFAALMDYEPDKTQAPGKVIRLRRVGEPHAAFEQP